MTNVDTVSNSNNSENLGSTNSENIQNQEAVTENSATTANPESTNNPDSKDNSAEEINSTELQSSNQSTVIDDSNSLKDKPKAEKPKQNFFDDVFQELIDVKSEDRSVEVYVKERIRGGLRVIYKDMPMFLPASYFDLKRNPSEEKLKSKVGTNLNVKIQTLQEDETRRKTVIVTRKELAEEEFWNNLEVDQIIEGPISSVASFGVFIDLGGYEGLVHVSRLSKSHIEDPQKIYKKGQVLKAKIVDINKDKKRIALSTKEFEKSPWEGVEQEFPTGTRIKGVIKRITDFGAYIELKPGVDGLLRTSEISWTRRLKNPGDLLKSGQEIEIEVLDSNEEKQIASLSLKRTLHNPWEELKEKFPVGNETKAKVIDLVPQGAVLSIDDEVDGFMPKSKMRPIMKGKKIPYEMGDEVDVVIADIVPDEESMILAPKVDEATMEEFEKSQQKARPERKRPSGGDRNRGKRQENVNSVYEGSTDTINEGSFSLGDLLSESAREKLLKNK